MHPGVRVAAALALVGCGCGGGAEQATDGGPLGGDSGLDAGLAPSGGCLGCLDGETCGSGGLPDVCAASATALWVYQIDDPGSDWLLATSADAKGNIYLLGNGVLPDQSTHTWIIKLDRLGHELGRSDFPGHFNSGSLAATDEGELYLGYGPCSADSCPPKVDFGAGIPPDGALVKLDANGHLQWQRELSGWPTLRADRRGNVLLNESFYLDTASWFAKVSSDGSVLWSHYLLGPQEALTVLRQFELGAEDNAYLVGHAWIEIAPPISYGPLSYPLVQSFDAAGGLRWSHQAEVEGSLTDVVLGDGALLMLGDLPQPGRWAGASIQGGAAVLAAGSDGSELSSWPVPSFQMPWVDPARLGYANGMVIRTMPYLVGSSEASLVEAYTTDGKRRWSRTLATEGQQGFVQVDPVRTTDQVLVAGCFSGTLGLGTTQLVSPQRRACFVLALKAER